MDFQLAEIFEEYSFDRGQADARKLLTVVRMTLLNQQCLTDVDWKRNKAMLFKRDCISFVMDEVGTKNVSEEKTKWKGEGKEGIG